jgi:hypothetical protein
MNYGTPCETWFDGKDGPNLTLLKTNVENARYWDNNINKLVSFFRMAKSAMTDENCDFGENGHIDLQNQ